MCGPSTFDLAKSLLQPERLQDKTFGEIVEVLEQHFSPKPSLLVSRFKFNTRERQAGESIATYMAKLRALGEYCNFGATLNDMIRDRLVCGVNDRNIQRIKNLL